MTEDEDARLTIQQLKNLEKAYGAEYWDDMPEFEDLSHLILHNTKMLGLLSSVCEVGQHACRGDMKMPKLTEALKRRIIGNFIIWATHYANVWNLSIEDCFVEKQLSNIRRARAEHASL